VVSVTYSFQRSTGLSSSLVATGQKPGVDIHVWLQVERESETKIEFVLYMEQPGATAASVPFSVKEKLRSGDARSITVRDAAGVTVVR